VLLLLPTTHLRPGSFIGFQSAHLHVHVILCHFFFCVHSTLGSVVASPGNCNTDILSGITTQIFKQMVQEGDGFAVITGSDIKRNSGCTPYLQLAALNALHRATAQKGASIVLNSAYRSAAEVRSSFTINLFCFVSEFNC
jgi:hypothetical protein